MYYKYYKIILNIFIMLNRDIDFFFFIKYFKNNILYFFKEKYTFLKISIKKKYIL